MKKKHIYPGFKKKKVEILQVECGAVKKNHIAKYNDILPNNSCVCIKIKKKYRGQLVNFMRLMNHNKFMSFHQFEFFHATLEI